jgi:hypothetical protein
MSVRRGPTEQDRSEGTLTKEGPNQEQAPLVTWGAFPSNSPKAKCLPLGRCHQQTRHCISVASHNSEYWHSDIFLQSQMLDPFLQ